MALGPDESAGDDASGVPGWFGKHPALGDFAVRRLPQAFTAIWDRWLVDGINSSRVLLGDRWLDCYLNAPVWRFGLMRGLVDERSWFGVMMPSVDRVGRYFPLTIASPIPQPLWVEHARGLQHWLERLQAAALTVLSEDSSLEGFEALLVALAPPRIDTLPRAEEPPATTTGPWPIDADDFGGALGAAALSNFWHSLRGASLWWSANRPALYRYQGLPPAAGFHRLLAPAPD